MKRAKRWISILSLATALGVAGIPARSEAHGIDVNAGNDVGEAFAVGIGITSIVLVVVGGAVWYFWQHRHAEPTTAPDAAEPVS